MKYAVWLMLTYLLLALESPLLGRVDFQFYAPDVALLVALFAASRAPLLPAVLCALAAGLLKDGFSLAAPLGLFAEINVLVVLGARLLSRRVDMHSSAPMMATAAATSLVATALFLLLAAIFDRDFGDSDQVLTMALPLALMTMLVAPILFALFDRVGRFGNRRGTGSFYR